MQLITLDEAKHHLRYDDDANDAALTMYIAAAESAINRYINTDVPAAGLADVKVAALMLIGYFDENRNADKDTPTNGNYLPQPVVSLLYPYRQPVIT
ncbi:head-tail connector protein [Psychrobacter pacificensis]|uniref:head-tail connector protein n=1 Tax=Psychrobacter pacificensis TaxID=112002 RepID=UPI001CBCF26B|nr:head-tail connector protein [Psychrobacter pacificensis]MBZ1392287.1 phage gp6-like head-tail connector protein [Psychrobacter pacificensis]